MEIINLKPSCLRYGFIVTAYSSALCALWLCAFPLYLELVLGGVLVWRFGLDSWRHFFLYYSAITRLRHEKGERWLLRRCDRREERALLERLFILPDCCLILDFRLLDRKGRQSVLLLPDSTGTSSFRKLIRRYCSL